MIFQPNVWVPPKPNEPFFFLTKTWFVKNRRQSFFWLLLLRCDWFYHSRSVNLNTLYSLIDSLSYSLDSLLSNARYNLIINYFYFLLGFCCSYRVFVSNFSVVELNQFICWTSLIFTVFSGFLLSLPFFHFFPLNLYVLRVIICIFSVSRLPFFVFFFHHL